MTPLQRIAAVLAALATCAACGGDGEPREPRSLLDAPAPGAVAEEARGLLEIPQDAPLVAFLGDSISAGLHLAAEEAFPAVLQRELAAAGRPFRLLNAGVSGDTSAGGLRRADWILAREPDVLVVELGANDGLRGQDPAATEANLRAIVAKARAAGARVLLLGMRLPTSYGARYTEDFAAAYERVAQDLGVSFVPFFMRGVGGVRELNLADGLHPSAHGHRLLAENVRPALEALLDALD